jgi:23S rRNA pseudouridine2605 synthase
VLGALSNDEKQRLLEGVRLDDGMAHFGTIEDGGGEGSNCWYRVTISEGRNREVRRLFESVGHAVSRLIRIRYGAMVLPRGLKRGAWMELDERDIRALFQAVGAAERPARGPGPKNVGQEGGGRNNRNRKRRGNRNGGGAQAESREPPIPNPLTSGPSARGRGGNGGMPQGQRGQGQGQGQGRGNRQGGKRDDRAPGGGGGNQPDPMKTSLGYIGADSFSRQRKEQRSGGPRRGGGGGPSGGNFGGQGGGQGGGRRRGR